MGEEETQTAPAEEKPAEATAEEGADAPAADDTSTYFTKAEELAKRVEDANKKTEELVIRQEKVAARMLLSGRTEAGAPPKTKQQEQEDLVAAQVKESLARFKAPK